MTSHWSTAWVLLPGTAKLPGDRWHRIHPERPGRTVCGRSCADRPAREMRGGKTPKGKKCDLCELRVEEGKTRDRRPAAETSQPGSVRALRGGLPGLGRRR